jgi:hypothetical protein
MDTSLKEKIFDLIPNQDKQSKDQRWATQRKKDTKSHQRTIFGVIH